MKTRIEKDTLGIIEVPYEKYWGAQTQRSLNNFKIGEPYSMPKEIIVAYAYLKKSCANANNKLGILDEAKRELITQVCNEIINGKLFEHFPLVVWQTGSGTHTNMNLNEVITNRAQILIGKTLNEERFLHPNDDVNMSQSSNDTFPTVMHIATTKALLEKTIPSLIELKQVFVEKAEAYKSIIKIGRTHLMDAAPLSLYQELSAYIAQIDYCIVSIKNAVEQLYELAIGGSAVGTGLNVPKGYDKLVVDELNKFLSLSFKPAKNKFSALSGCEAIVTSSGALKETAIVLTKIANDFRIAASGPMGGINEWLLPANEPGSSIMPGKVNPTQIEMMTMVCAQVMSNDYAISLGAMQGHFQLNVFRPMIINNMLQSCNLLSDACISFSNNCIKGVLPNKENISLHLAQSLMVATVLNTYIGYNKVAEIVKTAEKQKISLRDAAHKLKYVSFEDFDKWVKFENMI